MSLEPLESRLTPAGTAEANPPAEVTHKPSPGLQLAIILLTISVYLIPVRVLVLTELGVREAKEWSEVWESAQFKIADTAALVALVLLALFTLVRGKRWAGLMAGIAAGACGHSLLLFGVQALLAGYVIDGMVFAVCLIALVLLMAQVFVTKDPARNEYRGRSEPAKREDAARN